MINKSLLDDIISYCELNNIEDTTAFINKILEQAFSVEKYGTGPPLKNPKQKPEKVIETNKPESNNNTEVKKTNTDIYDE